MDESSEPFELSEPMPCFEFNGDLSTAQDDGRCIHCRNFLTLDCPYISHFLGEEDE